jgi:hypothetical protein
VKADLSLGLPPTVPVLAGGAPITGAAQPGRILLHHVGQGGDACRQAETLETRSDLLQASSTIATGMTAAIVVNSFMALLSSVDSAPRAYRLKVGNACPPISTSTGTSPNPPASPIVKDE